MKKSLFVVLVFVFCLLFSACNSKSQEAMKADELISAIGKVSLESESDIYEAQSYYDSLTDEQKSEVENYDILVSAGEELASVKEEAEKERINALNKQISDYIDNGEFIKASQVIYTNKDIEDYDNLVIKCGQGAVAEYIKNNGEEKESGKYFLNLKKEDSLQISVWYIQADNSVSFICYNQEYGVKNGMTADYVLGSDKIEFYRFATSLIGMSQNTQNGEIKLSKYKGSFTGSVVENDPNPFVIEGLTTTAFKSTNNKLTRGYQNGTRLQLNEIINTFYSSLTDAGYKGSIADIGFTAYEMYE